MSGDMRRGLAPPSLVLVDGKFEIPKTEGLNGEASNVRTSANTVLSAPQGEGKNFGQPAIEVPRDQGPVELQLAVPAPVVIDDEEADTTNGSGSVDNQTGAGKTPEPDAPKDAILEPSEPHDAANDPDELDELSDAILKSHDEGGNGTGVDRVEEDVFADLLDPVIDSKEKTAWERLRDLIWLARNVFKNLGATSPAKERDQLIAATITGHTGSFLQISGDEFKEEPENNRLIRGRVLTLLLTMGIVLTLTRDAQTPATDDSGATDKTGDEGTGETDENKNETNSSSPSSFPEKNPKQGNPTPAKTAPTPSIPVDSDPETTNEILSLEEIKPMAQKAKTSLSELQSSAQTPEAFTLELKELNEALLSLGKKECGTSSGERECTIHPEGNWAVQDWRTLNTELIRFLDELKTNLWESALLNEWRTGHKQQALLEAEKELRETIGAFIFLAQGKILDPPSQSTHP